MTRSQFTQYATGFWGSAVRTRIEYVGPTKVRSCVAVVGAHQIAAGPTWAEAYHDLRSRLETEERWRAQDAMVGHQLGRYVHADEPPAEVARVVAG
jgi:predicted metal-dependent TIM-barrel fold hydrolase